jgi:hypothetical protein
VRIFWKESEGKNKAGEFNDVSLSSMVSSLAAGDSSFQHALFSQCALIEFFIAHQVANAFWITADMANDYTASYIAKRRFQSE